MAEYIENVVAQTSKLDWAFPFERKGQFPIDRSAIFSSLSDATKYATGDGSDERKLGGTSYVGQIISVYEAGEDNSPAVVNAYIITPARGLMKLASTTASGDMASDVADLQGKVNTLITNLSALETAVGKMYTNEQIDALIEGAKDDRVDDLIEVVGKATEGETEATGLHARIEALEALDDADTTYSVKEGEKVLSLDGTEFGTTLKLTYNDTKIQLLGIGDEVVTELDASVFVADGVLENVDYDAENDKLIFTWNTIDEETQEKKKIEVDVKDLVDTYASGNGINIDNTTISVKVLSTDPYLTVDETGVHTKGIDDAIDVAKGEAISDAEGKIATAKSEAIAAAATDAESKVNALANGTVKDNTDAIAAINDVENGILAQAKADATTKADAAKSGAEATAAELYATKEYVGIVPEGKGDTVIAYINKKAEETLAAAQGGSSETAASVAQALQNYKDLNDPKVTKNTEDIGGLRTDLTTEAGKITNLQNVVDGHTTKITDLETLTSGHASTIESHTKSIGSLNSTMAAKAEQTDLDAANAEIVKNTSAITTLNETTIPGINTEINKKANSEDVYSKTAMDAIIGTPAEGKTIVDMIGDAQSAATYDDTTIKADIKKNTDEITVLNSDETTAGSVKKIADDRIAAALAGADTNFDTLKEMSDWLSSHADNAATMNSAITDNTAAIAKLNGGADVDGSVAKMVADATPIATTALAGLVKANDVENGVLVAEDGAMTVKSLNVNRLVQSANEVLILNGGSSNANIPQ